MNFQYEELVNYFLWYLLPFFRMLAFVMVAPVYGTGFIPVKIKVAVAVFITLAISPGLTPNADFDALSFQTFILILQQVVIGAALGFITQIAFASAVNAGQLIGMQMGLGFAQMMDPQTGVNVPVISQFYNLLAMLLFLSLNGHLVLIEIMADGFQILPIHGEMLANDTFISMAYFASWVFSGAVIIALPAVVALLMISVVMGVITRATPQMNIFAVGFSITILMGFVIMAITLATALPQMANLFGESFIFMRDMLQAT